jgi:hypothetical protein
VWNDVAVQAGRNRVELTSELLRIGFCPRCDGVNIVVD